MIEDLNTKKEDIQAVIDTKVIAFEKLSGSLGKKGMHRVLDAITRYPGSPTRKLMDEVELTCFTLLVDVLNANFTISLINLAMDEAAKEQASNEETVQE